MALRPYLATIAQRRQFVRRVADNQQRVGAFRL
jgi:hypothetical protein